MKYIDVDQIDKASFALGKLNKLYSPIVVCPCIEYNDDGNYYVNIYLTIRNTQETSSESVKTIKEPFNVNFIYNSNDEKEIKSFINSISNKLISFCESYTNG